MERNNEAKLLALTGLVLIASTFTNLSIPGPWDSASFTKGVLGLAGLVLIYRAWFYFTFQKMGWLPLVSLWQNPQDSWSKVAIVGLACLVFVKGMGLLQLDFMPEPAGLVITLIGLLILLNGIYVGLSRGPLNDSEEE